MSAAMHTSASEAEPDMFGAVDPEVPQPSHFLFELHGTMAAAAQVRVKPVGDGSHVRPVLCLEVRPIHPGLGRTLHAEQIYPEKGREAAEAKAATLKKGTPITLRTSLRGMRTILPHVEAVELTSPTEGPSP